MNKKNKASKVKTPKILNEDKFSPFAIEIVKKLKQSGFQGYLVGGCVRDSLVGIKAKDFDVSTDATPEEVRKLFRSSRIIGKRFRLVHVFNRNELIEVSTFRSNASKQSNISEVVKDSEGKILRDNVWGTLEEDCVRRDFSINALYFDPIESDLRDFHNGLNHIQKKILVSIGDPLVRFEEDPVRSLRAIRFSSKLNFKISNDVKEAIYQKGYLLGNISNARMFDEFCKIFLTKNALNNFNKLDSFGILKYLVNSNAYAEDTFGLRFQHAALINTDNRLKASKSITPGFLIAALLWPKLVDASKEKGILNLRKFFRSMDRIIREQQTLTAVPRKFHGYIKDIWSLQLKLETRLGHQPYKILNHPRFRAAYDFLLLREEAANDTQGIGEWWTQFQRINRPGKIELLKSLRESRNGPVEKKFGFLEELS
ncbi:polynucleotide adenylyltransferase PcnB [Gammaproteobacteria bacterium]|nr:polynucleotide adenylyltransferase PcnB [Gammaproteobacteria bacterium]MDC0440374.1 polynucleotide adenylyltransferase PcnB [Gammaproteobacteria bacterium]